jgi:hypothetical protein
VRLALDELDSLAKPQQVISPASLTVTEGVIIRLYDCLSNDKQWQHIIPYLGLPVQNVRRIRDQIKSSPDLPHAASVGLRLDAAKRLLSPPNYPGSIESEGPDPLELAIKAKNELEAKLAAMEAQHERDLTAKDEEIRAANLRQQDDTKQWAEEPREHQAGLYGEAHDEGYRAPAS